MWAIADYVSERRGETRPKAKTRIVHVPYFKQICVFVMHIIIYHMSMVYMFTKQTHVISMFSFHSVLLLALKHIIQECFVSHTIHMYIDTLQNIRIYYVVHVHELIDCTHINPCSGQNRLFLQLEFPQHHPPSCVSDRLLN